MLHILLITTRRDSIGSFIEGLSSDPEVHLELISAGAEAQSLVRTGCPHLVIVDSTSEDLDSFDLVRRIIGVNAMVNTAVASALSDEDFHDKGEGLGILCRLPPEPGRNDSKALLQKLRDLTGIG
jgi:DNA-binding response OmpR family regulator